MYPKNKREISKKLPEIPINVEWKLRFEYTLGKEKQSSLNVLVTWCLSMVMARVKTMVRVRKWKRGAGRLAGMEGEDIMYILCHIQLWYLMKLRIGSQINKVLQTYLVLCRRDTFLTIHPIKGWFSSL